MIQINNCTPGPWRTFVLKNDKNQTMGHSIHGSNGDKVLFIETPKFRHIEEIESNLALIAAAPQLYEALAMMLVIISDYSNTSDTHKAQTTLLAKAAIKKADQGEL